MVFLKFLYKKLEFLNFFKDKIYTKTHQIAPFKKIIGGGGSMPQTPLVF